MNSSSKHLTEDGQDAHGLWAAQRAFFDSGATLTQAFREERLRAFIAAVQQREKQIEEALWADLRKSPFEAWGTEMGMLLGEAKHGLKHVGRWMRPNRTVASLVSQPSRAVRYAQPLGTSLILGAWNYPILLSLQPLVAAITAGCTAVVKPSELSPASSNVMAELIRGTFSPEHVAAVEGGVGSSEALLAQDWDHFFYTGGTKVGRIVAHAAAERLARVTLELGGKSPAIVTSSANMVTTAKRIGWGKWINNGQTCIAPDYVLVDERRHDELVEGLRAFVRTCYGDDPQQSPDLGRMVNDRHFERVRGLIDPAKVAFGGRTDAADRYIEPTVLTGVTWDDAVMKEEIFGPVLPILKIRDLSEVIGHVRNAPNPLALYLFTESDADRKLVIDRIPFGGGCVNNTAVHLSDANLPFGGLRTSGIGAYHGKAGFDCFTHTKSVMESNSSAMFDVPVRYAPYKGKLSLLKRVMSLQWLVG